MEHSEKLKYNIKFRVASLFGLLTYNKISFLNKYT